MILVFTAVLVAAGSTVPASGADGEGDAPTATPIKHLIVIFQENNSFDHYFGTYPNALNLAGQPPFLAAMGTPAVDGLTPDLIANNPNSVKPFRLNPGTNGLGTVTADQKHGYRAEQLAAHDGLMDKFVEFTGNGGTPNGATVMGYFDGNAVTGLWNYAQRFALNDESFGTVYGPSTPGHINLVSGDTTHAVALNADGTPATSLAIPVHDGVGTLIGDPDPFYDDCSTDAVRARLTGTNVGDLLNNGSVDGGPPVTWGWFQGGFRADSRTTTGKAVCQLQHSNIRGRLDKDYDAHHNPFQYYEETANPSHAPPSSPAMIGRSDAAKHQYDLADFWTALAAHNLPAVSFLKARGFEDGHPGADNSNPLDEQHFLVDTINRIQSSPEWDETAIVIAYDDSDGWYDHVFPPNPHRSDDSLNDALYTTGNRRCLGDQAVENARDRCGYGPRIPLLVVSPFANQTRVDDGFTGFVDHTPTDQTSILRFIEDNWNLGRIGGESFDDGAGSLMNMFDFGGSPVPVLFLQPCTGVVNHPPTANAAIEQSAPRTNATLSLTVSRSDADLSLLPSWPCSAAYRDILTTHYQWQKLTGPGWTDLAGETSPTLDLSEAGNGDRGDQIRALITVDDRIQDGPTFITAAITVANTPPTVLVDPASTSAQYSDPIEPVAVAAQDDDGDVLVLSATGLPGGVVLADNGDGTGKISGSPTHPAGTYSASVTASDGTDSSTAPVVIEVTKEDASALYTGGLLFSTGSTTATTASVTLRAQVSQADDGSGGDLSKASVLFDLYKSANFSMTPDLSVAAHADASGVAETTVAALDLDNWTVIVRLDPSNGYFEGPASGAVVLTVYRPSPGAFVTGGGWVLDPSYQDKPVAISSENSHGNFGFTVRLNRNLDPTGHSVYAFRGTDGYDYVIKSNSWQGGGLAVGEDKASFSGRANVVVIDPETGALVSLGGGNFSYRVDVTDGDPDGPDRYSLVVYTSAGALYHRVGTVTSQVGLGGGNIIVRPG